MPARLPVSWRATNTPSEPHRMTSISGQKPTSNHRWGERQSTSQWRRTTTAMRCGLMATPSPVRLGLGHGLPGHLEERALQVRRPELLGDLRRRAVGRDPATRQDTRHARRGSRPRACCGWSPAAPCRPRGGRRAAPARTRSATSGSRDAVGSSSTSSRGRWSTAFTMPTSVRCPEDSSWPRRSTRSTEAEALDRGAHDGARAADAVEAGEDLERLEHRQVLG